MIPPAVHVERGWLRVARAVAFVQRLLRVTALSGSPGGTETCSLVKQGPAAPKRTHWFKFVDMVDGAFHGTKIGNV